MAVTVYMRQNQLLTIYMLINLVLCFCSNCTYLNPKQRRGVFYFIFFIYIFIHCKASLVVVHST